MLHGMCLIDFWSVIGRLTLFIQSFLLFTRYITVFGIQVMVFNHDQVTPPVSTYPTALLPFLFHIRPPTLWTNPTRLAK